MNDYLVRIFTKEGNIRGLACVTSNLVEEARRRHGTFPTASAALGRALTGGELFGALLKTGQRVALTFEGNGPLKRIIVEAESNGAVRGYVEVPDIYLVREDGKLDVAGALGRTGSLTVTKDLGLKELSKSVVPLYSGEIAEDLAFYLTESERIPSAVGLGVYVEPDRHVSAAGGFLIQTLPPKDEEMIDTLMERLGQLPPLTQLLREGNNPEQILEILFTGIPYDTLEKRALAFHCSCTRDTIERMLISLGQKQLTRMMKEQDTTEVRCEFCSRRHPFSREVLMSLIAQKSP
ncbi:MAG TPA: Hsp33 family molecular chaperone HslO [Nitrospira sp.]|nr:Hsp33 family molecular chaperone HslO [Nitrospira sp.]